MTFRSAALALAVAVVLVCAAAATAAGGEPPPYRVEAAGAAAKGDAPPPRRAVASADEATREPAAERSAAPGPELPGVALDALTPEQRKLVLEFANEAFCYCGCPHTLAQCLREHKTCRHAPRMAALAARLARAGARKDELVRLVTSYYASFDKRAQLDVARFGPPLGSPEAPVTLVEYSDFTCPYCQLVRPLLESFVEARKGRVKLVFKPFPIESHPGALELAQAAEWARDANLFWPMHDALFERPGAHSADELASLARRLGGDPESLRAALADGRYLPRIRASQAEARAAGIKGTPALFLGGRPLVLMDYSEEGLEFTLEDEEEWVRHRGWQRD
jgi:protein-disulfide isomerase